MNIYLDTMVYAGKARQLLLSNIANKMARTLNPFQNFKTDLVAPIFDMLNKEYDGSQVFYMAEQDFNAETKELKNNVPIKKGSIIIIQNGVKPMSQINTVTIFSPEYEIVLSRTDIILNPKK